jgi:hypothetical protein
MRRFFAYSLGLDAAATPNYSSVLSCLVNEKRLGNRLEGVGNT